MFCHSTFLVLHEPTDPALDFLGNTIVDQDNDVVYIKDVKKYQDEIKKHAGNKPWGAGEPTNLNGYYFTDRDGDYCADDELGVAAAVQPFIQGANGQALNGDEIASVILCPHSFDGSPKPNSYLEANNLIEKGINLGDVVPKSTTLVHELFHALFGIAFLSGDDERCG